MNTNPEEYFFEVLRDLHELESQAQSVKANETSSYPPQNLFDAGEGENRMTYIQFACAGFTKDELSVVIEGETLTISGEMEDCEDCESRKDRVRGISERSWRKVFPLKPYTYVEHSDYIDGILTVILSVEVPEELKPRQIEIK